MAKPPRNRRRALNGFSAILLLLFAISALAAVKFKTVVVEGDSMLPTFSSGQRLLVSDAYWLVGGIQHKDIVVVRDDNPDGYIIKRVYRLAGEKVPLDRAPKTHRLADGEYVVPPETLYVLGDNLAFSEDSRVFGPIPLAKVIGKVVIRP